MFAVCRIAMLRDTPDSFSSGHAPSATERCGTSVRKSRRAESARGLHPAFGSVLGAHSSTCSTCRVEATAAAGVHGQSIRSGRCHQSLQISMGTKSTGSVDSRSDGGCDPTRQSPRTLVAKTWPTRKAKTFFGGKLAESCQFDTFKLLATSRSTRNETRARHLAALRAPPRHAAP